MAFLATNWSTESLCNQATVYVGAIRCVSSLRIKSTAQTDPRNTWTPVNIVIDLAACQLSIQTTKTRAICKQWYFVVHV